MFKKEDALRCRKCVVRVQIKDTSRDAFGLAYMLLHSRTRTRKLYYSNEEVDPHNFPHNA